MNGRPDILLLAGSAEARQIGQALMAAGAHVHALVSEPPRGTTPMPMPYTLLDRADVSQVAPHLQGRDAMVDASHGFDAALSKAGWEAAVAQGVPMVKVRRPLWCAPDGADWHDVPSTAMARALIAPGARVFAATGWASLADFADFPGDRLFLRQTSRHERPAPFDHVTLVFGDPPFQTKDEMALFRDLQIDTLICRNLGGVPSWPKVEAALALHLRLIVVAPPTVPQAVPTRADVASTLDWIDQQCS